MKAKIAVIGTGNVGGALRRGLEGAGYEVRAVGKDPARVRETGAWGDIVILAVPYSAVDDAIRELGDTIRGKPLVDVTNVLTADFQLALGFTTSGAEELQKKASAARVVKAFNTVFAEHMATGHVKGTALTLLVAADDQGAKDLVLGLGRDIGFDAVDAGPLTNARWLETLGYLNIQLGYVLKMGTQIGFKLIH
ncbi:NADPH-dependent F420 reductase [Candidatus Nitrospira bockiana]